MAELCRVYEISRETGYYWLRRYREGGVAALANLDRAPHRHPNQTSAAIVEAVLELRRAHMSWGPRKLKRVLERQQAATVWPAASTIGRLVAREGLAVPRRLRRRTPPYTQPFASADAANRLWCADFKGWFRTRDGTRIDPLTITDAFSRYLLRVQAAEKTDTARVQAIFEAAFREHGMPEAIRTDNGAPFASRAIAGLSRLAVWWMKLGIVPERIAAGHPEQNGRHERMHRTLKQETAQPPEKNRRRQQEAFERFRQEYNHERPHEALEMQTPEACYRRSARAFPERIREPEYDMAMQVRKVQGRGEFYWKHQAVFLTETLIGERVGLLPIADDRFVVYFAQFPIAIFDKQQLRTEKLPLHFAIADAGEGTPAPSPAPHPPTQKVSGMCPV